MKCNICGNFLADNITFCPYCGSAVKKEIKNNQNIVNNHSEQNKLESVLSQNNNLNIDNNISVQNNSNQENKNVDSNLNNYNSSDIYNMQNYQSVSTEGGYKYNSVNNNITSSNDQYNMNNNINNVQVVDKTNIGLAILSWFIPIVGIILFFTMKKTSPKTSKTCGIVSLIAILISGLILTFGVITITKSINELADYNTDEVYETNNNIWDSYKVTINNKDINIPCSYNEFVKISGFKLNTETENRILNNYYYDIVNVYSNDKLSGIINVYNKTGSNVLYKNASVSRISQLKYNVETNKVDKIIFPGDLYAGKKITKDELIKLLGKPAKESETEYNGVKTYTLKYTTKESYTTSNYYEITLIGDSINELTLDNRP